MSAKDDDLQRKAIDDLYAVFAPDVVLEAEVEAIIARIVAIDALAATPPAPAQIDVDGLEDTMGDLIVDAWGSETPNDALERMHRIFADRRTRLAPERQEAGG